MLPLSDLKARFNAGSPFSPRDNLLGSSSPGEALLLSVNNYLLVQQEKKRQTDLLIW